MSIAFRARFLLMPSQAVKKLEGVMLATRRDIVIGACFTAITTMILTGMLLSSMRLLY